MAEAYGQERRFVATRQDSWDRLEGLISRVERGGLRALTADEIAQLGLGYRAATSDLAIAQSREYDPRLYAYLNRLTARAHSFVYLASVGQGAKRIPHFFAKTFPREVRRSGDVILAATALFCIAALVAYGLVAMRAANVYTLLPSAAVPLIQKSLHDSNFAIDRHFAPLMSTAIIINNVKVSAVALAGGMTFGIVTLWAVLTNGLMVGALGALFTERGFGPDFWATIVPHGTIELTAIQIAGGAGFLLARAMIAPGRLRRTDAIKESGIRAARLGIGVAGMLCIAGMIEGFFTPLRTSIAERIAVGCVTAFGLVVYFTFAGRHPDQDGDMPRSPHEIGTP